MAAGWTAAATLLLTFATWSIYLGGLSSLQHNCTETVVGGSFITNGYVGVSGFNGTVMKCDKVYRYWWFILALEIVLIVGAAAALAAGVLQKTRAAWVGLFAVATLLFIQASDAFLAAEELAYYKRDGLWRNSARSTSAGAVSTAILNAVLIVVLGWGDDEAAEAKKTVEVTSAV